jgi:hypothetical protein
MWITLCLLRSEVFQLIQICSAAAPTTTTAAAATATTTGTITSTNDTIIYPATGKHISFYMESVCL